MNIHTITAQLCAEDLIPKAVFRRLADRSRFLDDLTRYNEMGDDDLYRVTVVCLRNLERLDDESAGPDAALRNILIPELWARLRPGTRDELRRISSTLAEYRPDPEHPSIFARMLSSETLMKLRDDADNLRQRVAFTSRLDGGALVDQVRFALAGSRVADRWAPDACVYEPGFTYRLVPVVSWRVLVRARGTSATISLHNRDTGAYPGLP